MSTKLDGEQVLKDLQQLILIELADLGSTHPALRGPTVLGESDVLELALLRKVELYAKLGEAIQGIMAERMMQEKSDYLQKMLESAITVKTPYFGPEGGNA
jgi:DNA polymerase/3'-5' exonuclease PolX